MTPRDLLERGELRKLTPRERLLLGMPSNMWLCRDKHGALALRSGEKGMIVGPLSGEQLTALLAYHEGKSDGPD